MTAKQLPPMPSGLDFQGVLKFLDSRIIDNDLMAEFYSEMSIGIKKGKGQGTDVVKSIYGTCDWIHDDGSTEFVYIYGMMEKQSCEMLIELAFFVKDGIIVKMQSATGVDWLTVFTKH